MPHYRQIRAFHIEPQPLTIESGLLTANGKLRRDAIARAFPRSHRSDVPQKRRMTTSKTHPGEKTKTLSWELKDGVIELALHHSPCNEIGTAMLEDLEQFAAALEAAEGKASALIVYSQREAGILRGRRFARTLWRER